MPKKPSNRDQKYQQLETQVAELTTDLQRIQADFMNFRRRNQEELGAVMQAAKATVLTELLPLLDNIERALTHLPKELQNNQWAKGVEAVGKQVEASLLNLGVARIRAKGEPFDPNLHEAVSVEGDGAQEIVAEEVQTGYVMGDSILRPALVKVKRS